MRREALSFYDVLGVQPTASEDEIEGAWKRLVSQHHPDRAAPADNTAASARTAAINEAYQALGDPNRRERYDRRQGIGRSSAFRQRHPFAMRPEDAIDALVRLRRQRQHERLRAAGAAALGVAAVAYSLRAFKLL